jgi:hypothetical protein
VSASAAALSEAEIIGDALCGVFIIRSIRGEAQSCHCALSEAIHRRARR